VSLCPCCGGLAPVRRGGAPILLSTGAPVDPIAELTAEAKTAPKEVARIIRIIRDRLALQDRAGAVIEDGLRETYARVVDAIRDLLGTRPGQSVAERAQRLQLNEDTLRRILTDAGIGDLVGEVEQLQAELGVLVGEGLEASDLPVSRAPGPNGVMRPQVSITAVSTAASDFLRRFWEQRIIAPTTERLLEGLQSSMAGESLDAAVERLRTSLDSSVGVAATEARTRIAEFDRAVTAQAGAEAGATLAVYLGPVDGITRPFCAELAGLVCTNAQIGRLNNAQTAVSPLYAGGGYNCRHQWTPIGKRLAERRFKFATDDNIDRANARARASR